MARGCFQDLTGRRFGRYVVLGEAPRPASRRAFLWLCRCDCGNERAVRTVPLTSGTSRSCGCLMRDLCAARNKRHGRVNTGEYHVWVSMKQRCNTPHHKSFARYGGRGIVVCERWADFRNFIADMGERPSEDHLLERIDNDGPYSPENCRWATAKEQQRNMRTNHHYTFNGKTLTLPEWEEETGICEGTLFCRLTNGWSEAEAFTRTPNHTARSHRRD